MIKYFQLGVNAGDPISMHNLGQYYEEIGDHQQMEYYYQMAIEKGVPASMNNLGLYYKKIGNYQQMKK